MFKFIFTLLTFFVCIQNIQAQELFCNVKVLDNQIQLSDKRIFRTLEQVITEFMNTTKWTLEKVQLNERIECNIQVVLSSYDVRSNRFTGTLQIQSTRPAFGTSYNSVVFNFLDENLDFEFVEFQPMNFNENSFSNNLTSILAFYAYYIIGLDYDTFKLNGGTAQFQRALQVANNALPTGISGWQPFEKNLRSRYNLIDNILNDRFKPIREAYYKYHRQGMDIMSKTPDIARKNIFESLQLVQKVFKIAPNTVMLILFFEAKSDELVNIYKSAPAIEKPKVIELLSEINIGNISKYEKIR